MGPKQSDVIGGFNGILEPTLRTYNQTATDLENVSRWWHALTLEAQADPVNRDTLVEHGEKVLESELAGWVQTMQDALADLRTTQGAAKQNDKGRSS